MPIFVASRIMREQIFHGLEAEPAQREQARARDPIEFSQRLRDFHQLTGAACRSASTCISSKVSPSYSPARIRNAMSHGDDGRASACHSPRAETRPAPLRARKKEAADFRCRMAAASRANGENRN